MIEFLSRFGSDGINPVPEDGKQNHAGDRNDQTQHGCDERKRNVRRQRCVVIRIVHRAGTYGVKRSNHALDRAKQSKQWSNRTDDPQAISRSIQTCSLFAPCVFYRSLNLKSSER